MSMIDPFGHLEQFGIIQSLQRSPILQTGHVVFFYTRCSKVALVIQILNQNAVFEQSFLLLQGLQNEYIQRRRWRPVRYR